jgi:phosphoribosylglycinamide formyltransferase-1
VRRAAENRRNRPRRLEPRKRLRPRPGAQAGIPARYLPKDRFEEDLGALLKTYGIKLIILAGFLKILSPEFTAAWAGRIINIHPSLIPAFCGEGCYGLHVHEAALARGVKWTGATVHFVNEIPDGGEIILQKPVAVLPGDTPEALQERVMREAEWVILPEAAELVSKKLLEESL